MKHEEEVRESKRVPTLNEDVPCDVCGRFGAYRFGERMLCQECFTGSGSCCPEFGKDDLWTFQNTAAHASDACSNARPALNARDPLKPNDL